MRIKSAVAAVLLAGPALATEPLTAIDWLNKPQPRSELPGTVLLEPPVTGTAALPQVSVTPLEALRPPAGLVPASATGLPTDLWRGSDAGDISQLIRTVPVRRSPGDAGAAVYPLVVGNPRTGGRWRPDPAGPA